jgi:hypothetical protein
MRSEQIGEFEIEYSGIQLPEGTAWAAYLSIYGPSSNPMHRNNIFHLQRVCADAEFASEAEAEAEAHRVGLEMISKH